MSLVGTVLLAGVLACALLAAAAWWFSASRPGLARAGATGAVASAVLAAVATLWLQGSLLGLLPHVPYSVRVSSADLPFYYRISSMWSALEGSLLLWLLVLAVVSVLGVRSAPLRHRRLTAVTLMAGVALFALLVLVASPFGTAGDGPTPSPLLQDHVAMGVHPPLLYGGFAAAAVPHALAVAAVGGHGVDGAWMARVRRWTLAGWVLLTAGIGLGAWWSYAVLGWGGYWAWDPVENASLLPWLIMTALLHALLPGARAVRRPVTVVVLAGTAYTLVLLAQFLTRSGVVLSVHAFTESPLGPALMGLTVAGTAVWLLPLLARRTLRQEPLRNRSPRRLALTANLVLLAAIASIVLVGTVLPTLIATFTTQRVAVGGPWYARTLAPVALVLLVLLVLAPWLPARPGSAGRATAVRAVERFWPVLALCGLTVGVVAVLTRDPWLGILSGLACAAFLTLLRPLARPTARVIGGRLAHLAVVIGAVAVLAGGHGSVREATVPLGGTLHAGPVSATLVDLHRFDEGRRVTAEATVLLGRGDDLLAVGHPSLRWYDAQSTMLTSPAIRTGVLDDVYVTLLEVDVDSGEATLRLARTPLIGWLWLSGGLLVVGGVVAALPRRRVGTSGARSAEQEAGPETSEVLR